MHNHLSSIRQRIKQIEINPVKQINQIRTPLGVKNNYWGVFRNSKSWTKSCKHTQSLEVQIHRNCWQEFLFFIHIDQIILILTPIDFFNKKHRLYSVIETNCIRFKSMNPPNNHFGLATKTSLEIQIPSIIQSRSRFFTELI